MNTINFNAPFLAFRKDAKALAESPLICWSEPTGENFNVNDFPEAEFPNGCPRLPFKRFRVDGFYHYLGSGFMKFRAWVETMDEVKGISGYSVALYPEGDEDGAVNLGGRGGGILAVGVAVFTPHPTIRKKVSWLTTKYDISKGKAEKFELGSSMAWNLFGEWMQKLAIDFTNPNLYLCKKLSRMPSGKSIQWVKAREHYVLLHKNHSANRREAPKLGVISDTGNNQRIAHSRRAHYRLLSSPRFKAKQGQKVWIRSAWVGPKEWTDHSGQIYKIVDR